jgi:hypothetical protein
VALGFGQQRLTIYFEDGSWIRSQTYAEEWPNVDEHLRVPLAAQVFPEDFFIGIKALLPYAVDDNIYITAAGLCTSLAPGEGATYEMPNSIGAAGFKGSKLMDLIEHAHRIEIVDNKAYLFGPAIRVSCSKVS